MTTVTSRGNKIVTFISLLHHKTHFEISPTFRWNDCLYIARTNKYVVQKAHKMFLFYRWNEKCEKMSVKPHISVPLALHLQTQYEQT